MAEEREREKRNLFRCIFIWVGLDPRSWSPTTRGVACWRLNGLEMDYEPLAVRRDKSGSGGGLSGGGSVGLRALAQRNPMKAECRCFLVCTSGSLWLMPEEERKQ